MEEEGEGRAEDTETLEERIRGGGERIRKKVLGKKNCVSGFCLLK